MGVNAYFGPRRKMDHTQHLTMEQGNIILKLIITDRHISFQKTGSYTSNIGKGR